MTDRIRILCVDDHAVVQKGLTAVLEQESDMEVVAYAVSGSEAVARYNEYLPDITLMDLQLRGMTGFDAIRAIRKEAGNARIIVLTMYRGEADVARALSLGAAAYLLKDAPTSELIKTIRTVHTGGHGGPPEAINRNPTGQPPLTPREGQIMELLARGYRTKEVAAALNISENTSLTHMKSIFIKLGVHDRAEAVVTAIRLGIVHVD